MQPRRLTRWPLAVLASVAGMLAQEKPGFQVDVNLVRVPCVITDSSGAPVPGLRKEDFVVLEDGVPQELKYLWQESGLPLTVGLVADVTCSQWSFVEQHRQTLLEFLARVLSKDDRAFLVAVGDQQRLVTDLTNSVERLRQGVEVMSERKAGILGEPSPGKRIHFAFGRTFFAPCGEASLWNGVFYAARLKLRPQQGRKAMLLLTDGRDGCSNYRLADAIEACQAADTMVYAIRYEDRELGLRGLTVAPSIRRLQTRMLAKKFAKGKRDLERLSSETGGLTFEGEGAGLPEIFDKIETALRSEYVLGYTPRSVRKQGYRQIKVRVRRRGMVVRTRAGYSPR